MGSGPAGGASLWTSDEEAQALDSSLSPKLANTRKAVEKLLFEVVALEVPLSPSQTEPNLSVPACGKALRLRSSVGATTVTDM